MATYFYARVSSRDQDPKSQVESAIARGISPANIHIETASGARHDRPVLSKLLAALKQGDVLMTFRLDRLGRSLVHLVKVLEDLEARGVGFETLDGVSTQGSTGISTTGVSETILWRPARPKPAKSRGCRRRWPSRS